MTAWKEDGYYYSHGSRQFKTNNCFILMCLFFLSSCAVADVPSIFMVSVVEPVNVSSLELLRSGRVLQATGNNSLLVFVPYLNKTVEVYSNREEFLTVDATQRYLIVNHSGQNSTHYVDQIIVYSNGVQAGYFLLNESTDKIPMRSFLPGLLELRAHCSVHGWGPEPASVGRRNESASSTSTVREEVPLSVEDVSHRNWFPVFIAAAVIVIVLLAIVRWNRPKAS